MHQRPQQHAQPIAQQPTGAHATTHSPWPNAPVHPQHQPGSPIAGHAPHHQLHQPQQFQYAGGYVVPGAGEGHPSPMSAHDGTIGTPLPPGTMHAPMHGLAIPAGYHHPGHAMAPGAPMTADQQQPASWAYATPEGLQLVQPGANPPLIAPGAAPHLDSAVAPAPVRRRVRWETIVPALAVTCLVAAIALFIHDFDRITGREDAGSAGTEATATAAAEEGAASEETGNANEPDVSATLAQAQEMLSKGRFADASNALGPLLAGDAPDARAMAMRDAIARSASRNDALMKRLSAERRAGKHTAVIRTINQIEDLRPLSANLVKMRASARAKAKAAAAARKQAQRASSPAAANATGGGGGATQPPRAGGVPASTSSGAQPPANVDAGALPPRPSVPNPTGGQGGVAPTTGGGGSAGGQNCHTHDGVTECH